MKIGVPKELKDHETRVALTPQAVRKLLTKGQHEVHIQRGAGIKSGYPDVEYHQSGAKIVSSIREIYSRCELIVKVKEPIPAEYPLLRPGLILFCYLHLATNRPLTIELKKKRVSAFAFETLLNRKGETPLLKPMSEIAGRLSVYLGSNYLRSDKGGKGILLSPTSSVEPGEVVIVGGGHVGRSAAELAYQLGARVNVFDLFPNKLSQWEKKYPQIKIWPSSPQLLRKKIKRADLLIGAIYIPGAKTKQVIKKNMIASMEKGSVFVDVAIDQGGSSQTSLPTSISFPTYQRYGVTHCAIPNLPALVGRSATRALSQSILPYVEKIASTSPREWLSNLELKSALNLHAGDILHPQVSQFFSNRS